MMLESPSLKLPVAIHQSFDKRNYNTINNSNSGYDLSSKKDEKEYFLKLHMAQRKKA